MMPSPIWLTILYTLDFRHRPQVPRCQERETWMKNARVVFTATDCITNIYMFPNRTVHGQYAEDRGDGKCNTFTYLLCVTSMQ